MPISLRLQYHLKKPHYIILALGLLDIFRVLAYYWGDVFLTIHWTAPQFDKSERCKLRIYFLACVLSDRETENADVGNADLELSEARA